MSARKRVKRASA
nr:truncated L2 [Deltapapillomavirus 4]